MARAKPSKKVACAARALHAAAQRLAGKEYRPGQSLTTTAPMKELLRCSAICAAVGEAEPHVKTPRWLTKAEAAAAAESAIAPLAEAVFQASA